MRNLYLGIRLVIALLTISSAVFSQTSWEATTILPVNFTGINACVVPGTNGQRSNVIVQWKFTTEMNIQEYEVERSTNGISFSKIGTRSPTGNIGIDVTYNWLDQNPSGGNNYYRVRSIGTGRDVKYSGIAKVNIKKDDPSITIYPNPVESKIVHLQFAGMGKGVYQLRLVNVVGQILFEGQISYSSGNETPTFVLPNYLAAANYRLQISGSNNEKIVKGLMVKH